jgi:hypothetical protein
MRVAPRLRRTSSSKRPPEMPECEIDRNTFQPTVLARLHHLRAGGGIGHQDQRVGWRSGA